MNDAKSRFFANFEREMADEQHQQHSERSTKSADLDIDFSVTESGRTVAHMVTDTNRSMATALTDTKIDEHTPFDDDDMDFSITQSARSTGTLDFTESERGIMMDALSIRSSTAIGGIMSDIAGLTESDRGVLVDAFGPESSARLDEEGDNDDVDSLATPLRGNLPPVVQPKTAQAAASSIPVPLSQNSSASEMPPPPQPHPPLHKTVSKAQPIHPQPQQHQQNQQQQSKQPPTSSSQPNSYGSTGSAFMSSILNPLAGLNGVPQAAHTPPAASSYEVSHFGKRPRSGSVSGKLRSASDYLEEKGLLDRQTKSLLNDLFLVGDTEMQHALDRYEEGDPSVLEGMIRSGALQNRLPTDLDIMGNLDFDFLTVQDENHKQNQHPHHGVGELERMQQRQQQQQSTAQQQRSQPIPVNPQQQQPFRPYHSAPPQTNPPYAHDDGIGELDFAGDFVSDHTQYNNMMTQPPLGSQSPHPSAAASPSDIQQMTDYERRNRSNSLFSALLNDPRQPQQPQAHHTGHQQPAGGGADQAGGGSHNTAAMQYGEWMGGTSPMVNSSNSSGGQPTGMTPGGGPMPPPQGITVGGGGRGPRAAAATSTASGIAASLEAAERKRLEKEKKKKERERKAQEKKAAKQKKEQEDDKNNMNLEHYTGCGRPRSLSDPNLVTRKDEYGLVVVDRPDGWVGAYSPESRKVRIERFLEKRKHRVWTQSVKYDVRKNFADSRLRVKGRFVKKEDEMLMRELMSMT